MPLMQPQGGYGGGLRGFLRQQTVALLDPNDPNSLGGVASDLLDPFGQFIRNPGLRTGISAAAALPLPWGSRMGAGVRTAPALPMGERMRQQGIKDMWRDAQTSIEAAPTLSPGQAWARSTQNELAMREIGLGKQQIHHRALERDAARRAFGDQKKAFADHLNSLLPSGSLMNEMMSSQKGQIVEHLGKVRDTTVAKMRTQGEAGAGRIERKAIEPGQEVPQLIEHARYKIQNELASAGKSAKMKAEDMRNWGEPTPGAKRLQKRYGKAVGQLAKKKPGQSLDRAHDWYYPGQ